MNIRHFYLKRFSLAFGILKILKKKHSRSILLISVITKIMNIGVLVNFTTFRLS